MFLDKSGPWAVKSTAIGMRHFPLWQALI